MSDARWGDPREYGERDRDDGRPRVYDERDRDDHDPRDGLMHDLDLPRGEERELVVDRDRVYELNGEDSRTLAAVGAFRVVPEHDLDIDHETLDHLRDEGLVDVVDLGGDERGEKLDRLDEAFLFERSIDIETYDRHAEKLREELTLARIDRHSGQLEELDVEGILAFAERVLPRAADLWVQASLEQRQRFQQLFFPDGIAFDGKGFVGTARNRTGFQLLAADRGWK